MLFKKKKILFFSDPYDKASHSVEPCFSSFDRYRIKKIETFRDARGVEESQGKECARKQQKWGKAVQVLE